MPQNAFFLQTRNLLVSKKMMQRHFFSTLHPLSTVIFATATVVAFVLLHDSRFNFHHYTQREATPTQKSARNCTVTSCDILHERLQSAFTLENQLLWIAQYTHMHTHMHAHTHIYTHTHAHTHTHTHARTQTHTQTHVHAQRHLHKLVYWLYCNAPQQNSYLSLKLCFLLFLLFL